MGKVDNTEIIERLGKVDKYFIKSMLDDIGINRNSVIHVKNLPKF
jgi:hypothetical protein